VLNLLFQVGEEWYALDVRHVTEVLPLIKFKPLHHAPPGLVGVFNYHGTPVPLIDVSELIAGARTATRMSTRIILASCPVDHGGTVYVGLIVKELMETLRRTDADFIDSGPAVATSPHLGSITMDSERIIHQIEMRGLISGALYEHLFPPSTVSP
jgi:chemotaxis-related protein WspB